MCFHYVLNLLGSVDVQKVLICSIWTINDYDTVLNVYVPGPLVSRLSGNSSMYDDVDSYVLVHIVDGFH